ncbi:MAG: mechanosensitive ion channel [Flammeovirgaceae bacterium]|nr:mechanosensitive ion channel [Flammeovirgaceae bacterium]
MLRCVYIRKNIFHHTYPFHSKKSHTDSWHFIHYPTCQILCFYFSYCFVLQSLGVNITFLIASSAALLVGIGLGLQGIFKDFIAGIAFAL